MINYMPGALLYSLAEPAVRWCPARESASFHHSKKRGHRMTANNPTPQKLYLLQLSSTTVPIGPNRTLEMSLGCYLIQTSDGRNILIDTGIAPDAPLPPGAPKGRNVTNVIDQLAALKLVPGDIHTLICTHFDMDHAGYNDAFPRAEHIVQREHYELARSGYERLAAARTHWDRPTIRYRQVDGDTELLQGLALLKTNGHVAGHQSVLVRLPQTGPVLLAIDAVMMQHTFTPDRKAWPKDDNEKQLRASTVKLLDLVKRENVQLVVFGHDGSQWKTLKKSPDYYA
jgi:N-acyl homoserine lactone hydrolase